MSYPGRRLPFAVEFGAHAEPPPLNVSHLSEGRIVLTGGRRISGTHELRQEIAFVDEGKLWENADLYSKLIDLNSRGVPFQYQPKEMESPDILMVWWQDIGRLKVRFKEISWRNPDEWLITTIEPPVIGTHGWAGPKPFGC
ncbi:hypothetical protein G6K93_18900 [Agrobacterium rhizogenes]|uniref:Uncharacterized protein n=1 Tax=Rhizobium rhizogenes NBRC 13257 TaxID=1220581 RepID=A0AA87U2T1_RHIRH|nr:hypothetical protein [Rhizobium rhizogenes]NTG36250.1 hypothetical protein [Rhizobium rhizogenes]NTG55501.1 hypothetical protein [Rhizobium rhizogenes]NTG60166.1 hypothetical protein [Rhizobium rhizogenes]NTG66717.1 hypothetical protein [Rhizobium rhizogenes]NTG79689.1 hypothetical protein [Rhizobium rhizogenes]